MFFKNLSRDFTLLGRYTRMMYQLQKLQKGDVTVGKLFEKFAAKNPDKVCIYFQDQQWTFKQIQDYSNRIGNYFASQGVKKNDSIALFMENRPEYICTWLGLSKIGAVTTLVNYNLRSLPLKHCLEITNPKALIFGRELSSAVEELYPKGNARIPLYGAGQGDSSNLTGAFDLESMMKSTSNSLPPQIENTGFFDDLLYIYTSGTTGLPKAAPMRHARFLMVAVGGNVINNLKDDDILYLTLPLYHAAGGVLAVSQAINNVTPLVLRHKFSARNFWKDCIRYNVTVAQYMGETCRYLLRQPPTPEDKQHKVRLMFGNGLRQEIWEQFVDRFNIKQIHEVYSATEGNANLANITPKVGSVGFIPFWMQSLFPTTIIKLDSHGEPLRDPTTGLAVQCQPNEPGELVAKILKNHAFKDFKGYVANDSANKQKIIPDIFTKGDAFFRSGDIFTKDAEGYYYFKDRMGDSYRWKSENVSTTEVEYVISHITDLRDVVVYGVKVPGSDGQAGMAAIADPDGSLDLGFLAEKMSKNLPPAARPIFVKLVKEIEMTGTHKMKKTDHQKSGYDINQAKDTERLFFLQGGQYIPLDQLLYNNIVQGNLQL